MFCDDTLLLVLLILSVLSGKLPLLFFHDILVGLMALVLTMVVRLMGNDAVLLGQAFQLVHDVLCEVILGDIGESAFMVGPTTVTAERIPWHWQTHDVLPLLSRSRDNDNASIGGEVNADGDRLIASIIVGLTDSDKFTIPESLKVFARKR